MRTQTQPPIHVNTLKDVDFVLWRVARAKEAQHREKILRILSERPRGRGDTYH